jgi:hypothetical protein
VTNESPEPRLPGRTTPTWDMELLVSAASVFTLVQAPGWLDEAYFAAKPRLDLAWDILFRILYTYGKLGLLMLAVAFALHLAMRAYWIGLVGMDSIYPEGVRWDGLRMGPLRRRFAQVNLVPMGERIERADNRASIVFALGISMAQVMVALLVMVVFAYAAAYGLSEAFGWTWLFPREFMLIVVALAVPYALAYYADRAFGGRLAPDGPAARVITGVFAAYERLGYSRISNPSLQLLQSHVGDRRYFAISTLAILVCFVIAFAQTSLQSGAPAVGDYARWPAASVGQADSLLVAHYRDQGAADDPLAPHIDSAFPRGDFLTVVVPFNPRRHPAHLERTCPQAWRGSDSPARRAAVLECFGRWLQLRVDGQPVPALRPRYYTDPRSGQQAIAAVVPIRDLAPGEHELRLARAPYGSRPGATDPTEYRIAFWR